MDEQEDAHGWTGEDTIEVLVNGVMLGHWWLGNVRLVMVLSVVVFAAHLSHFDFEADGCLKRAVCDARAATCGLVGLIIPVITFAILQRECDDQCWHRLGPLRDDRCSHGCAAKSSSEAERPGEFLLRPWNAHSSAFLVAAGFRVNARRELSSRLLGWALICTGTASYAWWGSRTQAAWKLDNRAMEWMVSALAARLASSAAPRLEVPCVAATVAAWAARWPSDAPAALEPLILAMAVAGFLRMRRPNRLCGAGLACAVAGLGCKIADVRYDVACGTALFHVFEAAAFALLADWAP